jgi:hypothetical protein
MIVDKIKAEIQPLMVIPKPKARNYFVVKDWGKRRGENALIYQIPNNKNPKKPYEKGINESEWTLAYNQLTGTGVFTREWFNENLSSCAKEGSCNFTTIGGIFEKLDLTKYTSDGVYKKTRTSCCEL